MTKDEFQMMKEIRMTNIQWMSVPRAAASSFALCNSFVVLRSSFVIGASRYHHPVLRPRRRKCGADLRSASGETSGFVSDHRLASRGCLNRQAGGLPHNAGGMKMRPFV